MNSELKIVSEEVQVDVPVTIFHVRGLLDGQGETQLLEAVRIACDNGTTFLLIDLSQLEALTSAGMRALQKVYQMVTPREQHAGIDHLKLCNAPVQIYNLLGITGFLLQIPVYESIETALSSFGKE